MDLETNWRAHLGQDPKSFYVRKFAYIPVRIECKLLWLKVFYSMYNNWCSSHDGEDPTSYGHIDFVENITEEDYLVRKLIGDL